jgi:hypothetical protein
MQDETFLLQNCPHVAQSGYKQSLGLFPGRHIQLCVGHPVRICSVVAHQIQPLGLQDRAHDAMQIDSMALVTEFVNSLSPELSSTCRMRTARCGSL